MYAVIATGGKQYRVMPGKRYIIEKISGDVGSVVEFDQVLLLADGKQVHVGDPILKGKKIKAEIVAQGRAKKVRIIKFKRRKHHMKRQGHRQYQTEIVITDLAGAASANTEKAAVKPSSAAQPGDKPAVTSSAPAKKAVAKSAAKPAASKTSKAESKPAAKKAKKSDEE